MYRQVKRRAATLLHENGRAYQHLARLYSGITAGIWLVLFGVAYLLLQLSPQGGLRNLDTRALISTIQTVLILLGLFLTPFGESGISFVALDFIRGRRNLSSDLWEGFRHLKPLSLSILLRSFRYALVYFISGTLSTLILQFIPFSTVFYEDLAILLSDPSTPLQGRLVIVAVVYGFVLTAVLALLAGRLFYQCRMTRYIILDPEGNSSVKAVAESKHLMMNRKAAMLRLDLSFWWYHLSQALGLLLPIGALLISGFHVASSPREETVCWIVAGIGLVLRMAVGVLAKPKVAAVYALYYDDLSSSDTGKPFPQ